MEGLIVELHPIFAQVNHLVLALLEGETFVGRFFLVFSNEVGAHLFATDRMSLWLLLDQLQLVSDVCRVVHLHRLLLENALHHLLQIRQDLLVEELAINFSCDGHVGDTGRFFS